MLIVLAIILCFIGFAAQVLAICTIILAVYHLFKESVWCYCSTPPVYFKDIQNYNELVLYSMSMVFVFIFWNGCGCPTDWQWQIGIFVVFLGWINMIFFASNFPGTAIYVIMFKEIFLTFFRLILFAILLVAAFSLILFMMFYSPDAKVGRYIDGLHTFNVKCTLENFIDHLFIH